MIEGIAIGELANGVGSVTVVLIVGLMIVRGTLVTRREADAMREEIQALRKANEEQGQQLTLALREYMPAANSVMRALHQAAEQAEVRQS